MKSEFDVAIVGTGLAGLTSALRLADQRKVLLIGKQALGEGASDWAQGGIAAVLGSDDSVEAHVRDTLIAGAGLCDEKAVRFIVERSRKSIEWLINLGVPFTRDASEFGFHLTREGGHSHRRIIHAADATGHAVQVTLADLVRAHPNITLLEHHLALDVIVDGGRCTGIYVQPINGGPVQAIAANQVILAAGGAGKVYLRAAPPGTGIIAGGPMRAVFETLGMQDVVAKSTGSSNPYNMVRATFNALKHQDSPRSVAAKRNIKVSTLQARRTGVDSEAAAD